MHKIIENLEDSIDGLYDAKRNQYVGKNISKFKKYVYARIRTIDRRLSNATEYSNSEGLEIFEQSCIKLISDAKKAITWGQEYAKAASNTSVYDAFESYSDQLNGLSNKLTEVMEKLKAGEYVGTSTEDDQPIVDDTDVDTLTPATNVTQRSFGILVFSTFFGFKPDSEDGGVVDLTSINETTCKLLLRIPAFGYLIFPTGYDDARYWPDVSTSASKWLNTFKTSILSDTNYLKNLRRRFYRILLRARILRSGISSDVTDEIYLFISSLSNSTYISTSDDSFIYKVNKALNTISSECGTDFFQTRALLLPAFGMKGISSTDPKYVPSYFPKFDPYKEMLAATVMIINRLITCFCSAGLSGDTTYTKTYFEKVDTGITLSTDLYTAVDDWTTSDLRVLSETTGLSDSFDSSLISTNSLIIANPTADITNAVIGEEKINAIIRMKYYTASNPNFNADMIILHIEAGESTFFLYKDITKYKYIMSAIDYICFDPDVNPTSQNGVDGLIPFRMLMKSQFITKLFSGKLMFPIPSYIGTNFINSWLINTYWKNSSYAENLPQHIFDYPGSTDTSSSTSSTSTVSYPSSYKFNISAFVGDLKGTEEIAESDLFNGEKQAYSD